MTDIDTASALDAELPRVLDAHALLRERKISDRKTNLGYEDHVKRQKKFVRNRESIWCQHQHQWKAFTIERNRFNQMLAGSKIRANSAKVKECGHDTKKLYNLINGITGRTTSNPMPPAKTDKELADKFADFFLAKIRKIREDLADSQTHSPEPIHTTTLGAFQPMTVDEVTKIIRSMPSKSCASDVIPTSLLKSILDKIAGVITSITNI